jgi:hypothetical protein
MVHRSFHCTRKDRLVLRSWEEGRLLLLLLLLLLDRRSLSRAGAAAAVAAPIGIFGRRGKNGLPFHGLRQ